MPTTIIPRRSQRGSLLIVAMILSAVIGISLVSYLHLSRTALTLSNRGVFNNAAVNLAEQGLEEAMYSINQMVADPTYSWAGWNTHASEDKRRKWEDVALGQNARGEFRVYVYDYAGTPAPKIVSRALITPGEGNSSAIEKWIEVQLAKTSKFANGLVAKSSVMFSGNNATVDSWNSDPDNDGAGIRAYDASLRNDNGSVGSISVATDAVVTWNADVWGYVSTGGTDPTSFVGSNGSVLGDGSTNDGTWTNANVDPNRVSTNFSATFDAVTAPTDTSHGTLGGINGVTVLPEAGDIPSGGYYYYDATSINLSGSTSLTVSGDVILRVTGDISTAGTAKIQLAPGASLAIYTPGNVSIGGNGIANGTDTSGNGALEVNELAQPIKFQIWGTSTTSQNIRIAGNGLFSGVVYAPNAAVSVVGNGAVCGAIVANTVDLSGNAQFHYDESLSNFGGGNPFRVSRWRELTTAADRSTYSGALTW